MSDRLFGTDGGDDFIKGDILVMLTELSLGGWGEDGLRQLGAVLEAWG